MGYQNSKGINVWKNVPYAQPPVRFANPVWPPLKYVNGIHNATNQMGRFCIQGYNSPLFIYSEDWYVF
jgi:carboxylesterase type B